MIITTQARYYKYNRKPEIIYQHHLISSCDRHDPGIVREKIVLEEEWVGEFDSRYQDGYNIYLKG